MYLIFSRQRTNKLQALGHFSIAPGVLLALTLAYNYARFSSPLDFGNAHIPGVLNEPWYQHGILSVYAIPLNMKTGFGGSIFLSCPFLVLLFAKRARDPRLKLLCWAAIALLTLCLWIHGNPGGWQFSYRYAIELLPWMYLILLENSPVNASPLDVSLFVLSVLINACATYLFFWTNYITP
jgi:hypothetical protein